MGTIVDTSKMLPMRLSDNKDVAINNVS